MTQPEPIINFDREGISFQVVDSTEPNLNYGGFWRLFVSDWEPQTLKWIKDLSDTDRAFLDIGGWIGPTSIWGSKFFRTVHTYEPDPTAFKYLQRNAELNAKNIIVHNSAVTADGNDVILFSRSGLGSSMTSMYTGEQQEGTASGAKLSDILSADDFALIKIDIEGGERLIIDSLIEFLLGSPTNLILSLHYDFFAKPDEDFRYILNSLKRVYSKGTLENGKEVNIEDIQPGFVTVLCTK